MIRKYILVLCMLVAICSSQHDVSATPLGGSSSLQANRASIIEAIYQLAGAPKMVQDEYFYTDVPREVVYSDAVYWGYSHGIVQGISSNRFAPSQSVSREQLVTFLWRYAGCPVPQRTDNVFKDEEDIGNYALVAVRWASEMGLIHGRVGGIFDPKASITQGEVQLVLDRYSNTIDMEVVKRHEDISVATKVRLAIGQQTFRLTLYENDTAKAFVELLPLSISMSELNNNEKYHYLNTRLPVQAERPGQMHRGDFMLYGRDCLVLFYQDFSSSYSYTPIGALEDTTGLVEALGRSNITITFELE